MRVVSRYRKALEKRFSRKPILRRGFNFPCNVVLANRVRLAAKLLGCPIYPLAEEVIERGLSDIGEVMKNETLTRRLQRHLLTDHLLVEHLDPESRTDSMQAKRLRNAMRFLELYEEKGLTPEDIRMLLSLFKAELEKRDSERN